MCSAIASSLLFLGFLTWPRSCAPASIGLSRLRGTVPRAGQPVKLDALASSGSFAFRRRGIIIPPLADTRTGRTEDMSFELSAELKALVQIARDFGAEKIAPFVKKWDEEHYFPYEEVIKPMAQLGFFGTVIPEEYGVNNMGWLATMILSEEIGRACSSLRVQINMQAVGCAFPILRYGSEALRRKYIPRLVSADSMGGFAITEPTAGSDVMALRSTALDKMGSHWSPTGEITRTNVRIPKENILGKPGDGTRIVFGSLDQTRRSAAAGAVGLAPDWPDQVTQDC